MKNKLLEVEPHVPRMIYDRVWQKRIVGVILAGDTQGFHAGTGLAGGAALSVQTSATIRCSVQEKRWLFALVPVFVWLCRETHPERPNLTLSSDAH